MAGARYHGRQRAYSTLTADIEAFVKRSDERIVAIARASIQDVIINAQQAVKKGGRMRVDTGFLRASGQPSLTGMPSGPLRGEMTAPNSYPSPDDYSKATAVIVTIGKLEMGNTFFFGWTAGYAKYRELYDGFLEGSLQNWARIVAFNTDDLRNRLKARGMARK